MRPAPRCDRGGGNGTGCLVPHADRRSCAQRPRAEPRHQVGGAGIEHRAAVEAAAHREVGPRTVREPVDVQLGPARPQVRLVRVDLVPVEEDRSPRSGDGEPRSSPATARKPPIVTSMPAAGSGLPTRRFAVRRAPRSSAPDGATPSEAAPGRPRSWIVARRPGSTTRISARVARDPPARAATSLGRAERSRSIAPTREHVAGHRPTLRTRRPGRAPAGRPPALPAPGEPGRRHPDRRAVQRSRR